MWQAAEDRYEKMPYRRLGRSGLKLPAVSLGLWHNFGNDTTHDIKQAMCRTAFDHGITHSIWRTITARLSAARKLLLARF